MSIWKRLKGALFFVPKYGFYGAPHYGCGRADKETDTCPKPIDPMDTLFLKHDNQELTDTQLADELKKIPDSELYAVRTNQDWSAKAYAKFYKRLAIVWFSTAGKITEKFVKPKQGEI